MYKALKRQVFLFHENFFVPVTNNILFFLIMISIRIICISVVSVLLLFWHHAPEKNTCWYPNPDQRCLFNLFLGWSCSFQYGCPSQRQRRRFPEQREGHLHSDGLGGPTEAERSGEDEEDKVQHQETPAETRTGPRWQRQWPGERRQWVGYLFQHCIKNFYWWFNGLFLIFVQCVTNATPICNS